MEQQFEIYGVRWDRRSDQPPVYILVIYRTPGITGLNIFIEKLMLILESFCRSTAVVILCGDFNLDPGRHPQAYAGIRRLYA